MPFNLSTGEMFVLLVVAVLVFGGRLPEIARQIGRTFSDIKRSMSEEVRRMDQVALPDEMPAWDAPPDGADCDGMGGIPAEEPADAAPAPAPTPEPDEPTRRDP